MPAMRRAFNALKNGRPGPVMVEVPADVMTSEFAGNDVDYTSIRPTRSAGDARDIDDAAKMLLQAKSPIIIAGQGVLYAEASDELVALAELLDIPVMTTTDGKSAFPEDHALALGSGGVVYTGHGRQFLLDSDVIFAVGTSLTRHNISTPIIPPGRRSSTRPTMRATSTRPTTPRSRSSATPSWCWRSSPRRRRTGSAAKRTRPAPGRASPI